MAADDHDFAEVRSTAVLDETGRIRTLRYAPEREPVGLPASRIVLDRTITGLVEELRRVVPAGIHRDGVMEMVARAYRPGVSLSDAFARFVSALLPDLVVLDASDPALKALMAPAMAREVAEQSPTSRLALEAGARLLAAGYHQQVPVRPGFLNLFVMMEEERRALGAVNGHIEVRGVGRKIPVADAVRLVESDPSAWSPGVLLRPLAQDLMIPTAAYVGGPAEIAYHAQIGPSYGHFGIPRPALLPRPSVTLVEPAQARALESEEIGLPDLQTDPEVLLSRWARNANPQVEEAFASARAAIERELAVVEERLAAVDPTLRGATDSARGRALHQVETLREKATRNLKKRDAVRAERLRRCRDALLPGGSFQERGLGVVNLVARHGPAVVEGPARAHRPLGARPPGDPPVRIGITCYPTVGGSGAVAAELGKQLARRGHSIHFVSYRLPFRLDDFHENVRYHEVDLTTYSLFEYPPHDLALAAKMAEVGARAEARPVPRPLRDPARHHRPARPADARRRTRPS